MTIAGTSYRVAPQYSSTHGSWPSTHGLTHNRLALRAITRNEELYPEPEKFNPERFIGNMDSEAVQQVDAIFGFGRRVCPGKAFAEANVWLLMANIVATMNIEKSVDDMGQPITPNPEYIGSFVRCAYPNLASGISAFFSLSAHRFTDMSNRSRAGLLTGLRRLARPWNRPNYSTAERGR